MACLGETQVDAWQWHVSLPETCLISDHPGCGTSLDSFLARFQRASTRILRSTEVQVGQARRGPAGLVVAGMGIEILGLVPDPLEHRSSPDLHGHLLSGEGSAL